MKATAEPKTLCTSARSVPRIGIVGVVFLTWTLAAPSRADESATQVPVLTGPFVAVEGHVSLFSDLAEASILAGTFGYGARGGYRWCGWGVSLTVEHNLWIATEYDSNVVQGALNIGVGGEFIYADGFVRTALAIGPSILAFDTLLDDAGSVGIFLDVRPVGLRWALCDILTVGLDPINFALVAPVLDKIPLLHIQYRTFLYAEAMF